MDNDNRAKWCPLDSADMAAVIIGLGFLFLVGFLFWFTLRTMNTTDGFLAVWSAVGPIVGVVIGSIPAHFFRSAANKADARAEVANTRADEMSGKMAGMADKIAEMGEKMASTSS
jgi:membrane protein implicated in regulation of membrane protease activity